MTSASRRSGTRLAASLAGFVAIICASCAAPATPPPTPPPGPSTPAASATVAPTAAAASVIGRDWAEAGVIDPGEGDATTTTPPYTNPGSLGHPGAYQGGQADLLDVASGRLGLFAVGYLARDIRAESWSSDDGLTWTRSEAFPAGEGSLANGAAVADSFVAVVGSSKRDAAAWLSTDGRAWQAVESSDFRDPGELRISTVVPWKDGFVAAGHVGSLVGPIRAAFWVSDDGRQWRRAPDSKSFEGARVADLAVTDGGVLIAVGAAGDAQRSTGAVSWRATDPEHWERSASDRALEGAVMQSVTVGPSGIVAVGNDVASRSAVAWRSDDGSTWRRAPDAQSLENFGHAVEMRAVAWTDAGYVAGGHLLFGTQYPSAVVWLSSDGLVWTRAPEPPSFSQGKIEGLAAGGPGVVAVGSFGSPDFSVPTVWVSPGT